MPGPAPHGLRTTIDGKLRYVALTGADQMVVLDTDTLQIVQRIPTGEASFPFCVALPGNH